jgi:hypothetical protein
MPFQPTFTIMGHRSQFHRRLQQDAKLVVTIGP